MKFVLSIIRNIMPEKIPNYLGRWRIEHCNTKINNKIDLANEDHCGPCGEYALEKITVINKEAEIKDMSSSKTIG
jgi:hypothetical protein